MIARCVENLQTRICRSQFFPCSTQGDRRTSRPKTKRTTARRRSRLPNFCTTCCHNDLFKYDQQDQLHCVHSKGSFPSGILKHVLGLPPASSQGVEGRLLCARGKQ